MLTCYLLLVEIQVKLANLLLVTWVLHLLLVTQEVGSLLKRQILRIARQSHLERPLARADGRFLRAKHVRHRIATVRHIQPRRHHLSAI